MEYDQKSRIGTGGTIAVSFSTSLRYPITRVRVVVVAGTTFRVSMGFLFLL